MTARRLVWLGTALAVLSLGLPWRYLTGTMSYLTSGYYYDDCYYDYLGDYVCDTYFQPGYIIPGLPGGTYPGTQSDARFFVVAAIGLALIGGLHLGRARALRWAAYAGLAGVLLELGYGLLGGALVMLVASGCFWVAARAPVVEEVAQRPSRNPAT